MGSDFVSPDEAAKMLGRSRRAVTAYMKEGVLRRVLDGRHPLIPRADVEQLAIDIGANFPPMNRKTFFRLSAHVQKLEQDIAVLKRASGFYDSPLRPSRQEAEGFYQAAERAATEKEWVEQEIQLWADQFEKMDDVFFEAVGTHVGRPDSWRPFYNLCLRQTQQIAASPHFQTDLRLMQLHERLLYALKKMRQVILVWIEAGHSSRADRASALMDGRKEAVVRLLKQNRQASGE